MSQPTDKPRVPAMRFFKPEWIVQLNSEDPEVVAEANTIWQDAGEWYSAELGFLQQWMPPRIRALSDSCFHAAEVLAVPGRHFDLQWDDGVLRVAYVLAGEVRIADPREDWPISASSLLWLYHEIGGVGATDTYVHRVLLSDGRVFEIPFTDVVVAPTLEANSGGVVHSTRPEESPP